MTITKEMLESSVKSIFEAEDKRNAITKERLQGYFSASPAFRKRYDDLLLAGKIRIDHGGYALMDYKTYEELRKLAE